MTSLTDSDLARLTDYLFGEVTQDEAFLTEQWIAQNPERQALVRALLASRDTIRLDVQADDNALDARVRVVAERVLTEITSETDFARQGPKRPIGTLVQPRRSGAIRRWIVPTMLACAAIVGITRFVPLDLFRGRPAAVREVTTAKGQRASLELSDGTRVVLGVMSRLTVPVDFGVNNRTLVLDGEALFTVTQNARKPFVVRTTTSTTRVLGTTFSVRQYGVEPVTTVTVLDGKVALGDGVVAAGQQGIRRANGTVDVQHVMDDKATAFVSGHIVFDRAPLREVIAELNRWYDVQFVLDDPAIANEIVAVNFVNRAPEDVASTLDALLKMHHRRTATQIIFAR